MAFTEIAIESSISTFIMYEKTGGQRWALRLIHVI